MCKLTLTSNYVFNCIDCARDNSKQKYTTTVRNDCLMPSFKLWIRRRTLYLSREVLMVEGGGLPNHRVNLRQSVGFERDQIKTKICEVDNE